MTAQTQALAQQPQVVETADACVGIAARSLSRLSRMLNRIVDRMFSFDLRPEELAFLDRAVTERQPLQLHRVGVASAHEHANTLAGPGPVRPT
jgi:hypothetical protein